MKALSPALFLLPALFLVGCSSPNSNHTPPPSQFTISGTLVDLAAGSSGVVLQNNGANNLSVTSNGTFHFVTTITGGGTYLVTVMTQPASPAQHAPWLTATGLPRET